MLQGSQYVYDVINKVPMTKFKGPLGSNLFLVNTMEEWRAFYELMMTKKFVACDTETNGFKYYGSDRIVGMSFGWGSDHFYIPVRHEDSVLGGEQPPQLNMDDLREDLQRFFAQEHVSVAFHNAIFDRLFYIADGIEVKARVHDTMIMWKLGFDEEAPAALKSIASGWTDLMGRKHEGIVGPSANAKEKELDKWRSDEASARRKVFNDFVAQNAKEARHELQFQGMTLTQIKKVIKEELAGDHPYGNASKEDVHYGYVPIPLMVEYAATDTFLTLKIFEKVVTHGELKGKTKELYEHELKLSESLMDIQSHGLRIDRPYLNNTAAEYGARIAHSTHEIAEALGDPSLNLNSSDQLAQALQAYGIRLTKTTPSGALCVDAKVLNKLAKQHEIVQKILDLRKLEKIKSTYLESLPLLANEDDIVRTSFKQNVSTGRLALSQPNLSNQPRGPVVRTAFLNWSDEYIYLFADYSQVELRLLAHFSEDPILIKAYETGKDVHLNTCCLMNNLDYDEASIWLADKSHEKYGFISEKRTTSKTTGFGIVYGVGAPGLSEQIKRPEHLAHLSDKAWEMHCQQFIDQYFETHLHVKRFINQTQRQVRKEGFLMNPYGRIRRLPHARAVKLTGRQDLRYLEGRAERQGPNFLIQGTAGDVFKRAVVRVHSLFKGTKSVICNLIHDDINMFIHKSEVNLIPEIKGLMEDFQFAVPLEVDMEYSTTNWAEKNKVNFDDISSLAA